jgi:hypothetical protein
MTNNKKKSMHNVRTGLFSFDAYLCPADYHLNKDEMVSRVHDCIKLWEIHGDNKSIDLAISHLLNLRKNRYRV